MKTQVTKTVFSLSILALITTFNSCGRTQAPIAPRTFAPQLHAMAAQNTTQQVLVQFKGSAGRQQLQAFNTKYGLRTVNYLPQLDTYVLTVSHSVSASDMRLMLSSMSRESVVRNVEMNGQMGAF